MEKAKDYWSRTKLFFGVYIIFLVTVSGAIIYTIRTDADAVSNAKTEDKVILSCRGANHLIYDYVVDGIYVVDLQRGGVYNYWFCIPVNAKETP